jgi:hypothetical protein
VKIANNLANMGIYRCVKDHGFLLLSRISLIKGRTISINTAAIKINVLGPPYTVDSGD